MGWIFLWATRHERFALSRECPHLRIEIWGTRFLLCESDVGHPYTRRCVGWDFNRVIYVLGHRPDYEADESNFR
jgi:hypothetical protein